jgi:hypothetical protein
VVIKITTRIYTLLILQLLLFGPDAKAQTEIPRIETGVQFTALQLPEPINEGAPGLGGRFTYNLSNHFGLEAEVNHFPGGTKLVPNFGETEGLFGLRAGFAIPKGGMFLKARPGFIHFSETSDVHGRGLNQLDHFALDLGFVGIRYFSNHTYLRFDAGDTIITYGNERLLDPVNGRISRLSTVHNPQISIGVGIHF